MTIKKIIFPIKHHHVSYSAKQGSINFNNFILKNQCPYDLNVIYIIKELVLKNCSKCYASWGKVAKLRRITGLPKNMGARERERERAENKNPGGGGTLSLTTESVLQSPIFCEAVK